MQTLALSERSALADKILANSQEAAESVTQEFFLRHPDWLARYGERGRKLGIEDALYHQQHLACAIQADSTASFAQYAQWTVSMLGARNIAAHFVSENLEQVARALQGTLTSSEYELVKEYVQAACTACLQPVEQLSSKASPQLELARGKYLQAVLKGERREATTIALDALEQAKDVVDLYDGLFQATQCEVGRLWQTNQITVAEEHMATAITQYVMAKVYDRFVEVARGRGRIVITGIEGELHQVGSNMVADVLEARGWDVRYLGANLPLADVLAAIEEHKPVAVGISATMLFSIPKAVALVQAIRTKFASACPRIIVGGHAFVSTATLARELQVEGPGTDLRSALTLFEK